MTTTKRRMLVGTVIVAALIIGAGGSAIMTAFNPGWNHGGDPSDKHHPNPKVDREFDPKWTMLLYMDVNDDPSQGLRIRAVRLQFRSKGWQEDGDLSDGQTTNTWSTNQNQVTDLINLLNSGRLPTASQDMRVYPGMANIVFNQPHHVIVYIKNKNVGFDGAHPVWFADTLLEPDAKGKRDAHTNRSFFAASIEKPVDSQNRPINLNYSQQVIYMKNFFRGRGVFGYYTIGDGLDNRHSYALNINTDVNVTDTNGNGTMRIPLILDPDTGNMGGGDPP